MDPALFREKFVQEARERLGRMNNIVVFLEKNPGDTRLQEDLLRDVHTLKGAARMMGFAKIAQLSHRFEEAITLRRERKTPASQDLTDALFRVLDTLSRLVEALTESQREIIDIDGVVEQLRLAQPQPGGVEPLPTAATASAPSSDPVSVAEPGRGIRVEPGRLERLADLLTDAAGRQLRQIEIRKRIGEQGKTYRRIASELLAHVQDAIAQGVVSPEFVAGVAPLLERGKLAFREIGGDLADLRRREDEEETALSQAIDDIRTEVLALQMVPLLPLFESFHRAVRDLSRQLGKEADLVVRGGKTEIDRKVAEAIVDPIVHLIRNAVDHGIEAPDVRAERGKPASGRITITATPKKGRVVIEVEDDGTGIDLQDVRDAAVRKGMITEKTVYRLDDREVLAFLFQPGFTTAHAVTEVSGRGIGLDIVRAMAERFNGTVELFTAPGKGTRVVLELPLSMAMSRALLFSVGSRYYGIPVMHADGVVPYSARGTTVVEGKRTLRLDGEPVPVVSLARLFGVAADRGPRGKRVAVLVRHSHRRIALVVDRVEGEAEVIVKDLGSYLGKLPLFIGSTIFATGEIALLLDVFELVAATRLRPEVSSPAPDDDGETGEILVVDESLLSREMQQRILSAAGYRVESAGDARTAYDLMVRKSFDLVVGGVQTPGADGAALAAMIRGNDRLRDLPVILVTSRDQPSGRERAFAAGVAACIDREDFSMERLVPVISRLIG